MLIRTLQRLVVPVPTSRGVGREARLEHVHHAARGALSGCVAHIGRIIQKHTTSAPWQDLRALFLIKSLDLESNGNCYCANYSQLSVY